MTENEAISALKIINTSRVHPFYSWEEMAEVRDIAIKALEYVQEYLKIGTVEECREAVEKTKAKKPEIKKMRFSEDYCCNNCGHRFISKDETGWFCGEHEKFCQNCGTPVDWSSERLESEE